MGMDSRHLETLLWVVRLGGIGAAAQHLNLTQPAVTRRIQELERELGAKVFRRQGRNVALTPVGQTCLGSAERILSEVATMRIAASGKAAVGTIRVGVVESIALTWFQNFLARIEGRYPKVQMEIELKEDSNGNSREYVEEFLVRTSRRVISIGAPAHLTREEFHERG